MANRGIIIPARNDIPGSNLQIEELSPNTSQKNSVYDGEGQSGYVSAQMDQPAATVFVGEAYSTGSRMTTGAVAAAALAAAADWSGDAGHVGNDTRATAAPALGLAAYLRERVQRNPAGANDLLVAAEVDLMVTDIVVRVVGGLSLTATDLNTIIGVRAGAGGGNGNEVLCLANGQPVLGGSFGSVSDVLRILSGEVYYVPTNTVIADEALVFLPETHPDGVGEVAGGATNTRRGIILTLAGAGLAADPLPVATGRFLVEGEAGYITKRQHALNDAFLLSCSSGKLRTMHDNAVDSEVVFNNQNGFAYVAADVTAARPRAVQIDGTVIAVDSITAPAVRCYNNDGALLNVP